MSTAESTHPNIGVPWQPAPVAALLSYLIPGLGQIVQGRVGKGLLFMVSLLGMFFLGQAMGQWRNVYIPTPEDNLRQADPARRLISGVFQRWHYAGQFFIGVAAWPALWQFYDMKMPDTPFWHDYQRGPRSRAEEEELNEFVISSDKTPDLGWVYTVIAGMLNVLVVYDAFAGPAFLSVPGREGQPAQPQGVTP
jgi:hypothetical protein